MRKWRPTPALPMREGAISLFRLLLSLSLTLALLLSCSSTPENVTVMNQLPSIYPDYMGVTIPEGIAPLNFNALDEGASSTPRPTLHSATLP